MTIDPIYLAAFALLIVAVTWFCARLGRNGGSTGEVDVLTATVGGVTQERLCAKALCMDGTYPRRSPAWMGEPKLPSQAAMDAAHEIRRLVGEPSPHADGEGGGE